MSAVPRMGGQSDVVAGAAVDLGGNIFRSARAQFLKPALVFGLLAVVKIWALGLITWVLLGDVETTKVSERSSRALGDSVPITRNVIQLTSNEQLIVGVMVMIGFTAALFFAHAVALASARTTDDVLQGKTSESPSTFSVVAGALAGSARQLPALLAVAAGVMLYGVGTFALFAAGIKHSAAAAFGLLGLALAVGILVLARFAWWPFFDAKENQLSRFAQAWTSSKGRTLELLWVVLLTLTAIVLAEILLGLGFTMVVGGSKGIDDIKTVATSMVWTSLSLLLWFAMIAWQVPILVALMRRRGVSGLEVFASA